MKMMNPLLVSLSLTLLFHFHVNTILAQSPAASPAAPPVPTAISPTMPQVPTVAPTTGAINIIKILEKAGNFAIFVRLLKSTSVGAQINSQLNHSNNGLTIFAPSDNAFSGLKSGTLNSLTGPQQIQLLQFHILPTLFSITQFQTATNPLKTQAGDTGPGQFPLNVTTTGNQVNVSTGVMNTSILGNIYMDKHLALYQVDSVLLPWSIFGTPVPTAAPAPAPTRARAKARAKARAPALALAPAPLKPTKETPTTKNPSSIDVDASGAVSLTMHGMVVTIGVVVVASFL